MRLRAIIDSLTPGLMLGLFISTATVSIAFAQETASTTSESTIVAPMVAPGGLKYGLFDPDRPCTGILIDGRHLKDVQRCQSPVLLAETDDQPLALYPDPLWLPNMQDLQENGIVRFFHTVETARQGFVGDNPYIIRAVGYSGPFRGDLVVSKSDGVILSEMEKAIHFTRTWHVGFLLPNDK